MSRFQRVVPFLLSPLVAAAVVTLSACSSPQPKFQDDQLLSNASSPFSRSFNYASTDACEASRRALLSQGYMTTMTHNDTVDATKNFQPASDSHIVVEVHVVCTAADASNTSMVYVNAVQNGYTLKKSDTSASVGLSIIGSVSLPIRSNSDSMVKVSSETIQSGGFYDRFFDLVGRYLATVARSEPVPGSGAIRITPLPPVIEPVIATTMPAATSAAPSAVGAPAASAPLQPAATLAMPPSAAVAQPAIATTTPAATGIAPPAVGAPAAGAPLQPAVLPVATVGTRPSAAAAQPAVVQTGAATGVAIPAPVAPVAPTAAAGATNATATTAEPPMLASSTATLASTSASASTSAANGAAAATTANAAPANTPAAPAATAPATP